MDAKDKNRWLKIGGVLFFVVLGLWIFYSSRIDYPEVVRIGDGSAGGRYANLNAALYPRLSKALADYGSRVEMVRSQGSLENLHKVENGEVHLAFYQEGVGHSDKVRSVINLEYEYVYAVVRRQDQVGALADLKGKRINLGPKDSGMYALSRQVLDYYPLEDFVESNYSLAEAVKVFEDELDGALFVTGAQAPALVEFLQEGHYQLLPLPFARAMSRSHSSIIERTVPAMTFQRVPYPLPAADLPTLAVKSSIIAGAQVAPAIIETVVRTMLETPFAQETNLAQLRDTGQTGFGHTSTQFQLHEGARAYFFPWEPKIPSDFVESWNGIVGFLVLLASGVYTGVTHLRQKKNQERQEREMAKKNALDLYIKATEQVCQQVIEAENAEALDRSRRELNAITLRAAGDYREERFRSSEDFNAFTSMASFVLDQIEAKAEDKKNR